MKDKVIAYMATTGLTLADLAETNNLNLPQLQDYFDRDWGKLENKFFYEELGPKFWAFLSQLETDLRNLES
jgi:hypothetical protein